MARYKPRARKKRLIKAGRQTRWAPIWAIQRKYVRRIIHPSTITKIKRHWRRSRIKA